LRARSRRPRAPQDADAPGSCAALSPQLDDECYNNTYWASVGGVALSHLNQLEVEVMSLLNFNLLVSASSLEAARCRLLRTPS